MDIAAIIILLIINWLMISIIYRLGYIKGHYDGHKHAREGMDPISMLLTGGKKCKNHVWARDKDDNLKCARCGKGIEL